MSTDNQNVFSKFFGFEGSGQSKYKFIIQTDDSASYLIKALSLDVENSSNIEIGINKYDISTGVLLKHIKQLYQKEDFIVSSPAVGIKGKPVGTNIYYPSNALDIPISKKGFIEFEIKSKDESIFDWAILVQGEAMELPIGESI